MTPGIVTRSILEDLGPDVARMRELLTVLVGASAVPPIFCVAPGTPVPKGRPRFGQRRAYTPAKTRAAQGDLAWWLKAAAGRRRFRSEPLGLITLFFLPTHRWIDGDNLVKLVMDAGTHAGVWTDDKQIVAQTLRIERGAASPRTAIAIGPLA